MPKPRIDGGRAWWAGAALLLAAAVALTAWAGTRPSYDAYGWLVWGHMTLHGGLDTNAAPSFKPLPYVFTVVFALFGGAQMRLWLVTSTAVSLAGLVFAGRLAWGLSAGAGPGGSLPVGGRQRRRAAGALAAALAVAGVLCIHDEFPYGYLHYVLSAQSDPMIVALVLGAIDCQLARRPRWAFALLGLASLGRPEAWPFLVADAVWLWRARPGMRPVVAAGLAAVALLWFGVPALSSRSWLVAADNADASGFGPRGDKALGVLSRFVIQAPWPLSVAAALGVGAAARRRDRVVAALAACVVVWLAVEVAFALHGWPALGRYMFEASALVIVLGAGFTGRLLVAAAATATAARAGAAARAGTATHPGGGLRGAAAAAAIAIAAATTVLAVSQGRAARADLLAQRARTTSIDRLTALVTRLGGPARVRACGESISRGLSTQTVLADTVGRNVSAVGYRFPQPGHPTDPVVVFTPLPGGGWRARARRQVTPACRALQRRGPVTVTGSRDPTRGH